MWVDKYSWMIEIQLAYVNIHGIRLRFRLVTLPQTDSDCKSKSKDNFFLGLPIWFWIWALRDVPCSESDSELIRATNLNLRLLQLIYAN